MATKQSPNEENYPPSRHFDFGKNDGSFETY